MRNKPELHSRLAYVRNLYLIDVLELAKQRFFQPPIDEVTRGSRGTLYHAVYRRTQFDQTVREFPGSEKRYWERHLGARGYFWVTSGELTQEQSKEYLAHHFDAQS